MIRVRSLHSSLCFRDRRYDIRYTVYKCDCQGPSEAFCRHRHTFPVLLPLPSLSLLFPALYYFLPRFIYPIGVAGILCRSFALSLGLFVAISLVSFLHICFFAFLLFSFTLIRFCHSVFCVVSRCQALCHRSSETHGRARKMTACLLQQVRQ